jgi:pSer/pThr/pTyr-binding forkhead associated (FHA) protein
VPAHNTFVSLPDSSEVLLGRNDAVSGVYPDIDLTPYGGIEHGVGRRHLRLWLQQGQAYVEDLDSTNGTFVNGQRLNPNTPQPVQSGDELRLGRLVLRLQL